MKKQSRIIWPLLLVLLSSGVARAAVNTAPLPPVKSQFFSSIGLPLAFGCVFTYQAGTTNALATYTDGTGSTPNANPTILDAGGFASIWLGPQKYKISVFSFGGVACASGTLQYTIDNVYGPNLALSGAVTFTAQAAPTCNAANYALWADSGATFLKACNNGTISTVVTDTATQTLTNKTLNAPSFIGTSPALTVTAFNATSIGANTPGTGVFNSARFKGEPTFNVKAYGAIGNCVADDTAAINAALAAFPISGAGGVLFFPTGCYKISSALLLNSYYSIVGSGAAAITGFGTVIKPTGAIYAFAPSSPGVSAVINVILQDFTIDLSDSLSLGCVNWRGIAHSEARNIEAIYPGTGNKDCMLIDGQDSGVGIGTYYNNFYNVYGYTQTYTSGTQQVFRFINNGNQNTIIGGGSRGVSNPVVVTSGNGNAFFNFSAEQFITAFEDASSNNSYYAGRCENGTNCYVLDTTAVRTQIFQPQYIVSTTNALVDNETAHTANVQISAPGGGQYSFNGATAGTAASMSVGCGTVPAFATGTSICAPSGSVFALTLVASGTGRGIAMQRTVGVNAADIINDGADNMSFRAVVSGKTNHFFANNGDVDLQPGTAAGSQVTLNGSVLINAAAPTISSGFGTSPSIVSSNGTAAFQINVGTGGTASSGVIGLGTAAAHFWTVHCENVTTAGNFVRETASTTTTATVTQYSTGSTLAAWVASDKLNCMAVAF